MSDEYDSDIPIELSIEIKSSYTDIEKFSEDAYKILSKLYSSSLHFKVIDLYSFIPEDENKSYHFQMEKGEKSIPKKRLRKQLTLNLGKND